MEKKWFTWEKVWKNMDSMIFSFTNVRLIIPIGEFCTGMVFPLADVDFENGTLEFFDTDGNSIKKFTMEISFT